MTRWLITLAIAVCYLFGANKFIDLQRLRIEQSEENRRAPRLEDVFACQQNPEPSICFLQIAAATGSFKPQISVEFRRQPELARQILNGPWRRPNQRYGLFDTDYVELARELALEAVLAADAAGMAPDVALAPARLLPGRIERLMSLERYREAYSIWTYEAHPRDAEAFVYHRILALDPLGRQPWPYMEWPTTTPSDALFQAALSALYGNKAPTLETWRAQRSAAREHRRVEREAALANLDPGSFDHLEWGGNPCTDVPPRSQRIDEAVACVALLQQSGIDENLLGGWKSIWLELAGSAAANGRWDIAEPALATGLQLWQSSPDASLYWRLTLTNELTRYALADLRRQGRIP